MTTIRNARRFITAAPREALADALGLVGLCLMIFAGFTLPGML
ncbi:MAG: hypothetical protein AAGI70_09705 [Pseudomonadota bacterium]